MLLLADVHNADLLMAACIPIVCFLNRKVNNFQVRSHIRQLLCSADWEEMKNTNPQLVNLVLEKVVTYDSSPPPNKRIRLQEVFYRH